MCGRPALRTLQAPPSSVRLPSETLAYRVLGPCSEESPWEEKSSLLTSQLRSHPEERSLTPGLPPTFFIHSQHGVPHDLSRACTTEARPFRAAM